MKRYAMQNLPARKKEKDRLPMIMRGVMQAGKTWLMNACETRFRSLD